ncbi:MAG: bifunctional DNA-formamidopyrimidine glycosylase/DNA-(apurinic or apyrimidinic site) lyase [Gemmatimonadaceae bacterium]|nr:bifunctional DNA-formamidopyrimidine glycosylase/DNA-(apurinic or apyrimidinic site) lyase [Gemmatimonadaceae bacterium]
MPELPEIEHARRVAHDALDGRRITRVQAFHATTRRALTPTTRRRLEGQRVLAVTRRAKYQLLELENAYVLEVHFRMTGDWAVGSAADPVDALERARFTLDNGARLSLLDGRAFASLRLHAPGRVRLPPLGPEPLDAAFTPVVLAEQLRGRRGPIKPVLLDQRVVAGLGNIYAAEACWVARIDPRTAAHSLGAVRVARLTAGIKHVLEHAPVGRYYQRPATVGERVVALGEGNSDDDWRVYDREGQPCLRCARPIVRTVQSGRSTYWCRGCQR